jgi:GTP cyclohydrolase I
MADQDGAGSGRVPQLIEELLRHLGEDPRREGLEKTPQRVAEMFRFLTAGYAQDLKEVLNGAVFTEDGYDEMVVVKDIDFHSLCVSGRQLIPVVGGAKRACTVVLGDRLWTLDQGVLRQTEVTRISARKTREIVEVRTAQGAFRVTPDHPVMTEYGWREAQELKPGTPVEWIRPRSLCRRHREPQPGYALGYVASRCRSASPHRSRRRSTTRSPLAGSAS